MLIQSMQKLKKTTIINHGNWAQITIYGNLYHRYQYNLYCITLPCPSKGPLTFFVAMWVRGST